MAYRRTNRISLARRVAGACLAIFLIAWGTLGLLRDDLLFPGAWELKLHLRGLSAWLMFGAMICAAVRLLTDVVRHYDRRDNARDDKVLAHRVHNLAWALFGAAIVVHVLTTMYGSGLFRWME